MKKPIVPKQYRRLYEHVSINRVLEVLFKYPEKEFSLSELAKEANVAKANIGSMLSGLKEADIIKIEELSRIWRIKANQNNPYFIKGKIVYNINLIYQYELVEFLLDYFRDLNPKSILLFGSFRRGEDLSKSDIDIAIETEMIKEYTNDTIKELDEFEKSINRKVQIHLFNRKNIDINLFNNIANGIILWGFLQVNP